MHLIAARKRFIDPILTTPDLIEVSTKLVPLVFYQRQIVNWRQTFQENAKLTRSQRG